MTPAELARLRIPLAALPGFDPVGLRCRNRFGPGLCYGLSDIISAVRVHHDDGTASGSEDVTLDLSDSSTADRVARWLAGRVGLDVGCTAPFWDSEPERYRPKNSYPRWRLYGDDMVVKPFMLADLDPTDHRRLPDGSRFVDRLALALVAVHVGGTP